jgi:hypothetical protein
MDIQILENQTISSKRNPKNITRKCIIIKWSSSTTMVKFESRERKATPDIWVNFYKTVNRFINWYSECRKRMGYSNNEIFLLCMMSYTCNSSYSGVGDSRILSLMPGKVSETWSQKQKQKKAGCGSSNRALA